MGAHYYNEFSDNGGVVMSHSTGTENEAEQRRSDFDRRASDERRNQERLKHMQGECRKNAPRRATDASGRLVEGQLWWNGF